MFQKREPLADYLRKPGRRRLSRVVGAYQDYVWSVALHVSGSEEDAADITQDVFLGLLLDPPPPERVRSPRGYLAWRVMTRASRMRRSEERRLRREEESVRRAVNDVVPADDIEALRDAINALPDEFRLPIELRYIGGLRNAVIAEVLGVPLRTLESRMAEGREMLRRRLAPLALGVFLSRIGPVAGPAPPALRWRLRRMAAWGSSLSAGGGVSLTAFLGGTLVAKKTCILAAAALVAALAGWRIASRLDRETGSRTTSAPFPAPLNVERPGEPKGLQAPPAAGGEPLAAPARARLTGAVRDEDGNPLPGIQVRFFDNVKEDFAASLRARGYEDARAGEIQLETLSGPEGEFSFEDLLPGDARVGASAPPGFFLDGEADFELVAGKEARQDLMVFQLLRLTGRVTDGSGNAIPGAEVLIREHAVKGAKDLERIGKENNKYVLFRADAEGAYDTGKTLRRIPEGGTTLLAWAKGYGMSIEPRARPLEASSREAVRDFELGPERPLVLHVRDPAGMPISGAAVGAGDATSIHGWIPYPLCRTDVHGVARVDHLARRTQSLSVAKEGYRTAGVELGADGPEEIAVTLSPLGATVEARIVYDERFPEPARPGCVVWLLRETAPGTFQSQGDSWDGVIRTFRPGAPGTYRFSYRVAGEVHEMEPFPYDAVTPVVVEIPITVRPSFIEGVAVRSSTGEPVEGAKVVACYREKGESRIEWAEATSLNGFHFPRRPGSCEETETDKQGRFLLLLPAQKKSLEVELGAGDPEHGWAPDRRLSIEEGGTIEGLRLELEPSGQIEGQVLSSGTDPVPGELVAAYDGIGYVRWTVSDSEGRFRVSGLRSGFHALEALGRAGLLREGYSSGRNTCAWTGHAPAVAELFDLRVEVPAGGTASRDIDIDTDRLGAIEGRAGEGLPRSGTVKYVPRLGDALCSVNGLEGTTVVEDGRFRIENLHEGEYGLYFSATGSSSRCAAAEVFTKRGLVAKVTLEPGSGSALIPLPGIERELLPRLQVLVERQQASFEGSRESSLVWWPWAGARLEAAPDGAMVRGLPAGIVRVGFHGETVPETWTDEVGIAPGSLTRVSPLAVPAARTLHLRIEMEDGSPAPRDARIEVRSARGIPACKITRSEGESAWRVKPLAPGKYELHAWSLRKSGRAAVEVPADGEAEASITLR